MTSGANCVARLAHLASVFYNYNTQDIIHSHNMILTVSWISFSKRVTNTKHLNAQLAAQAYHSRQFKSQARDEAQALPRIVRRGWARVYQPHTTTRVHMTRQFPSVVESQRSCAAKSCSYLCMACKSAESSHVRSPAGCSFVDQLL